MKIYRIASPETDIRDLKKDIKDLRDDLKDAKKDNKDFESRIKKLEKMAEELNAGNRLFFQTRSIFTSLQRKIEKFEIVQDEWVKYKAVMDDKDRKKIEQKTKNL